MNVSAGLGRGAGGPRRLPLMSTSPGKHRPNTMQEAGR